MNRSCWSFELLLRQCLICKLCTPYVLFLIRRSTHLNTLCLIDDLQAWDDAPSVPHLLCLVHLVWDRGHSGLQVGWFNVHIFCFCNFNSTKKTRREGVGGGKVAMLLVSAIPVHAFWNFSPCFFSDSSDDKQTKPKAKDGTKAENGSSGSSSTSRQDYNFSSVACGSEMHKKCFSALRFFSVDFSRPPKKNFVEVTELTDITYMSNLVKLRPGHMNIVLVLTDASKNILLSKFAKEVYSFTG